jgi:hypothetical protein
VLLALLFAFSLASSGCIVQPLLNECPKANFLLQITIESSLYLSLAENFGFFYFPRRLPLSSSFHQPSTINLLETTFSGIIGIDAQVNHDDKCDVVDGAFDD